MAMKEEPCNCTAKQLRENTKAKEAMLRARARNVTAARRLSKEAGSASKTR
jgi:hypothetical protein